MACDCYKKAAQKADIRKLALKIAQYEKQDYIVFEKDSAKRFEPLAFWDGEGTPIEYIFVLQ